MRLFNACTAPYYHGAIARTTDRGERVTAPAEWSSRGPPSVPAIRCHRAAKCAGTAGPDRIVGTSRPDRITGHGGADTVLGLDDSWTGWLGNPLTGGGGMMAQRSFSRTNLPRSVALVDGEAFGWDVEASLGAARASTHATYDGMVRTSALAALLTAGRYRIGANAQLNDASVYALLAPESAMTATSGLHSADLRASREASPAS